MVTEKRQMVILYPAEMPERSIHISSVRINPFLPVHYTAYNLDIVDENYVLHLEESLKNSLGDKNYYHA